MRSYDETGAERDLGAERPGQASESLMSKKKREGDGQWERGVLEKLAFASLKEQRRARRWRLLFTFLFIGYVGFITWQVMGPEWMGDSKEKEHTAMVRINGVIAEDNDASVRYLVPALRKAFEDKNSRAVILSINSPGGSPVQSGIVRDEILRLKAKHNKPVYAVISDIGASGGYYVAVAADKIFVDKASLVGSIGVLMNGFGFTGTMEKLGVERRLIATGEHKAFLDPFSPENPADAAHARRMLGQIQQQFIAVVREGRGNRLKETPEMFSGLIWTGEEAVALGLADQLGSVYSVAREVVQHERIVDYTRRKGLTDKLGSALGASMAAGAMHAVQQQGLEMH